MTFLEQFVTCEAPPAFAEMTWNLAQPGIEPAHIPDTLRASLRDSGTLRIIQAGDPVAIAVGSREIANLSAVVRTLVESLKEAGAAPFIIPAMGSHGGATAEGQREVLAKLGIAQETVGAEVRATMETVCLGTSATGMAVHLDKYAHAARYLIPVARVKPHTDFRGPIESGLQKMLVVGAGKQRGAASCHEMGWERMAQNIMAATELIIPGRVLVGVALVENASHETCVCQAVPAEALTRIEPELLRTAKSLLRSIPFEKVDILILERMGKDISGSGMDPNIIGRSSILGRSRPDIDCIAVLDLTDASCHNATGVGKADVITRRLYNKIDLDASYVNGLTGLDMRGMQIPVVMPNDRLAYYAALMPCWGKRWPPDVRICWMRDTMHVNRYFISESLVEEARGIGGIQVSENRFSPAFDQEGAFVGFA